MRVTTSLHPRKTKKEEGRNTRLNVKICKKGPLQAPNGPCLGEQRKGGVAGLSARSLTPWSELWRCSGCSRAMGPRRGKQRQLQRKFALGTCKWLRAPFSGFQHHGTCHRPTSKCQEPTWAAQKYSQDSGRAAVHAYPFSEVQSPGSLQPGHH